VSVNVVAQPGTGEVLSCADFAELQQVGEQNVARVEETMQNAGRSIRRNTE
jgi:hypothetical protein